MKISDTQWQVVQVIWSCGPIGAAEVIDDLVPKTGWSHRTVRTLLTRLVEKGVLRAELIDGRNIYTANVPQSQCIRDESKTFLEKVFGGDAGEMLVHFVENEDMTLDQIKQLRKLLDSKQKGTKKR